MSDLAKMRRADKKVLAAVMIATWAHGFSAIDAQWELAMAGLAEFRNPFVVGDELWKPMSLAPGMAGLIDQLSRTNRTEGIGQVWVTHSPKDAEKLPTHEDRERPWAWRRTPAWS
jgi:sugar (pentulose or hexulose) kinase